jgi:hypothetical protein
MKTLLLVLALVGTGSRTHVHPVVIADDEESAHDSDDQSTPETPDPPEPEETNSTDSDNEFDNDNLPSA